MNINLSKSPNRHEAGVSLIELLMVVTIIGILGAIAIPQMVAQRRLLRSAAVPKEIVTQLRFARQQAMTQRQMFTFQYDNTTKQIKVIDNGSNDQATVLNAGTYPNNAGSTVVLTSSLAISGLSTNEINYGSPSGLPTDPLGDGISKTDLTGSGKINITFRPDGSSVDNVTGNIVDRALFIYNPRSPAQTAAAISITGAAGRVKLWRYATTPNKYTE